MPSNAIPTVFRAAFLEARDPQLGSANAGYHLARHLEDQVEEDDLEALADARADNDDETSVWEWIAVHLPECAELAPRRRRASFTRGVFQALEEG